MVIKVTWVCGRDTSLTEVGSRENERKTIGNNKNNQHRTFAMKKRRETLLSGSWRGSKIEIF